MAAKSGRFKHSKRQNLSPKAIPRMDLFIWVRRTLLVAFMYPPELERYFPKKLETFAKLLELSFEIFLYFATIHIDILFVCTLYLNVTSGDGDLELIVNCLIQAIVYSWSIFMKLYFRRMRGQSIKEMIDFINQNYSTRSAVGFTYVTMDESLVLSNKWVTTFAISCFGATIFWLVLPIAYGDQSLPLSCWYPFDFKQPIVYETMYFLQFVGQIQVAAAFAGSSGFYASMAVLISGQYDNLYCSLKNVIATGSIDFQCSSSELKILQEHQRIADEELNQYFCSTEHHVEVDHLSGLRPKKHNKKPHQVEDSIKSALKDCICKHHFIMEALQKMENFFNPIWFFKNTESMIVMCLIGFVSVKSTTDSSLFKVMSLGQYLVLAAWEMFFICYFGEMVYLNSLRCGEALMRCPWYLKATHMKNDFLIFLMNANKPFKLTAGKILVLNVERYRVILTTAFSFVTLLQKMDQRN